MLLLVSVAAPAQPGAGGADLNRAPRMAVAAAVAGGRAQHRAQQNATILKAKNDLEASHGRGGADARGGAAESDRERPVQIHRPERIEDFPGTSQPNQNWNAGIQIVQAIYEGGKLLAAIKAADATKQQALAQYQTGGGHAAAVRLAYYDVLLAAQQITVNKASVKLLQKELDDQQRRFDAGTVPHFNVLRAEVALANASQR